MFSTSKIKLNHDTAHQKSTVGKILEWMQAYPKRCNNTNATILSKSMGTDGVGVPNNIRQTIQKMVNNQMLQRTGNKRRSDFRINYLHKDIPPYILENAPEEVKRTREKIELGLEENQYLDEVGCIVTKPDEEEEKEQEKEEEYPELDELIEQLSIPVTVHRDRRGEGTNISITFNLNLNN